MNQRTVLILLTILVLLTSPVSAIELVNESFESNFPPPNWQVMTSGQGPQWNKTDARAHTGSWSAVVFYGNLSQEQDEWLVTPALDTRGLNELQLEFWEDAIYWHPLYSEYHEVLYSTTVADDPAAFSILLHMTPGDHPIDGMDGDPVVLDLTELIGHETLYLALRYVGTGGDVWYVDDFRCYQPELNDVGVNTVGPDLGWFHVDREFIPTVEVENFGSEAVDCVVELDVASNGNPQSSLQLPVTDLLPGEVRTVAFPLHMATPAGWYDLTASAILPADADPDNNHGAAVCFAYSRDRLSHGLFVTNWDCSGCPQANQAIDSYLADHPDELALVRVHGWWPGDGDDPMYLANVPQCRWLINDTPPGPDYAPHLWLDGTWDAGADGDDYANLIPAQGTTPSPLDISVSSENGGSQARIVMNMAEPIAPGTELVLRLAVIEDGIQAAGSNGESQHEQVFRYLYPDTNGVVIPTENGNYELVIDTPLEGDWDIANLHLVVWVRDEQTKQVFNSALCEVVGAVATAPLAMVETVLGDPFPNPFNPRTSVVFTLPSASAVEVGVYDLGGRRLALLAEGMYPAGTHRITWQGRDKGGRNLPSGTYILRIRSNSGEDSRKLLICR